MAEETGEVQWLILKITVKRTQRTDNVTALSPKEAPILFILTFQEP